MNRAAGLEVGFGLPPGQETRAAEILCEAFDHILRPMFGSRDLAREYISGNLVPEGIVSATIDGSVVGLAALRFDGVEPLDFGFWRLVGHLGPGVLRFFLVGMVFMLTRHKTGEMYLDMLAVDSGHRGMGIGGSIIEFILDFARKEGFPAVSLHVIDSSQRARRFYEGRGFEERGYVRIFPWDRVLGFRGAYEMYRRP
jgi:ribosomal protein S18 acetylase RimI-like enzyme